MSDLPAEADIVFVGAGHNALVAAAYLLAGGRSVCLLDRMDVPGGFVRTEEMGAAGFLHDRWSSLHPAFVGGPAFAELGADLRRHGLSYVTAPVSTGSSLPDGRAAIAPVDPGAFGAELERLGEASGWGELFTAAGPYLPALLRLTGGGLDNDEALESLAGLVLAGHDSAVPFGRLVAGSAVDLVTEQFRTEEFRSLAVPWPLHLGSSPASPGSALWATFALAALGGGNPTPAGGSGRLADALAALVAERGGEFFGGVDVDEIIITGGQASGVRTTSGATVLARQAVVVTATPDVLYARLLRRVAAVPAAVRAQAARYQYRRGCFQVNLALSARPRFQDSRLDAGGAINLGRGVRYLVDSVRQAEAGLLPRYPSIAWHEPTAVDPSRAPHGRAVLRLQILDAPHSPVGDAAGMAYGRNGWDDATAEAFADRVVAEAEAHAPGLTGLILERHLTTPADLARQNPNAGPGDHAAGDNSLSQALIQRPIASHGGGYRTKVPGVWLIGAATWPGPGINGGSGRAVARELIGKAD